MPLLLLALHAVPLFPSAARSSGADIAAVTSVQGQVTVKRSGSAETGRPSRGAGLRVGDEVRTGDDGRCQVTLTDDSFINLGPRSAARINQFSFDERADRRTAVLQVLEGHARIVIYKVRSKDSKIRIEAEPASVIPDGLADIAIALGPDRVEAAVLQGGARVRNRLSYIVGEVRLRENLRTTVVERKPPTAPSVVTARERQDILKIWKGF